MANQNKIILVGRLAANPEIRTTMDAIPLTRFQLAVERPKFGTAPVETDHFDIIAWRNSAEYASQNLSRGSLALIEGRIQNRSFETKEGVRKYATEIVASTVVSLDPQQRAQTKTAPAAAKPSAPQDDVADDYGGEDLPF